MANQPNFIKFLEAEREKQRREVLRRRTTIQSAAQCYNRRTSHRSPGSSQTRSLPRRHDINSPDLYIPVMGLVTYIIAVGIYHGWMTRRVCALAARYARVTAAVHVSHTFHTAYVDAPVGM